MPNAKILAVKQQQVKLISDKFKTCVSSIVADYRGLNVAQVTELRKRLSEVGVEMKVVKNTISRRATADANLTDLDQHLTGPTAIAFSPKDVVAAAKILVTFAKKNEALKVKGGIVEGQVIDHEQIKELADLPSREALLSMLLSVLQAPVRNFALAVKAVAEKQESGV